MSDSQQYVLKYGEKALEYYRKSLQKLEPARQESEEEQSLQPIREKQKKLKTNKRLTLDDPKQLKLKDKSQKNLSRSKSKAKLSESYMSPKAIPTLRKQSKEKNSSQIVHSRSKKKSSVASLNKRELEHKMETVLEIKDLETFVKEVLSNIGTLIHTECSISKWLKTFKSCFQRLYGVAQDYICKYARACQQVDRLTEELKSKDHQNSSLTKLLNKERAIQSQNQRIIQDLTRKLDKLQKREKMLMTTFEMLKNGENSQGQMMTPSETKEPRQLSSIGSKSKHISSLDQSSSQYR